jgi:spore maturation protein SpmB
MNGAVALIIGFTAVFALCRKTELYPALTDGIRDGLSVVYRIFPPVAAMLTAVYMFRASGALEVFTDVLRPYLHFRHTAGNRGPDSYKASERQRRPRGGNGYN